MVSVANSRRLCLSHLPLERVHLMCQHLAQMLERDSLPQKTKFSHVSAIVFSCSEFHTTLVVAGMIVDDGRCSINLIDMSHVSQFKL